MNTYEPPRRSSSSPSTSPLRHLAAVRDEPETVRLGAALAAGDWNTESLVELCVLVGGVAALEQLDTEPLPDEPFDRSAVVETDRTPVDEVLALAERCCDEMFDVELRTAVRRVLARVAAHDQRPLRRGTSTTRLAAGLVWVVAKGNAMLGPRARWNATDLWWHFRVSPASHLGLGLRNASGVEYVHAGLDEVDTALRMRAFPSDVWLGDVGLLVSRRRAELIAQRDTLLQIAARAAADREMRRPFVRYDDRSVEARARPVAPLLAVKGVGLAGRAFVVVGFGGHHDGAELFAMSIPEAHHLARLLAQALADPIPTIALPSEAE